MATTTKTANADVKRYALWSQPQLQAILDNLEDGLEVFRTRKSALYSSLRHLVSSYTQFHLTYRALLTASQPHNSAKYARVKAEITRLNTLCQALEGDYQVAYDEFWARTVAGTWDWKNGGTSGQVYDRMMKRGF